MKRTPPSGDPAKAPSVSVVEAVLRVVRPLVRLLLRHGIQYPFLGDLLKSVYVDVATKEFRIEGRPQTQSRISLLTGVHRKDVRRLSGREQPHPATVPAAVSLGLQVVGRWLNDPTFLDAAGRPRPLPRLASQGGEGSFEVLVSRVSKDIRSRAVLDEWLRLGVVDVDDKGLIHLDTAGFVPAKGTDEKVFFLGQNVHDHLATAVHNVAGIQPPLLERAVFYDGLSDESVAELAAFARQRGMRAITAVNRRATELQKRDAAQGGGNQRMNFGMYFYHAVENEEEDDPDPAGG